jgi:hypothetical protein
VANEKALSLANSGKLELRAKGLLATGGAEDLFDACALLHEAARIQQRAVKALPASSISGSHADD